MTAIKDLSIYNNLMRKGVDDKLFFLDKVDCTTFVDFGCADGSLFNKMIEYLHPNKDYLLIGYDINVDMIKLANERTIDDSDHIKIVFTSDWNEVMDIIKDEENVALILSSILHEIYSYSENEAQINSFYEKIRWFDWICFRDMMFDSSFNVIGNAKDRELINVYGDLNQIKDFESLYGPLDTIKNQIHFLLKYRYKRNWQRELKENYFAISLEDFLQNVLKLNFQLVYLQRDSVDYVKDRIEEDFGIKLNRPTHAKIIFRTY